MESRFLEPSVSRTSRYFEPILVSLGFASLKLYNFTPGFSNPRILLVSSRHVGVHLGGHQHGVSIQISINLGEMFLRISPIKKNSCVLNLGESLCISAFFLFPVSRLNRWNGFDFLFWSILNGVTLKTSNYAWTWVGQQDHSLNIYILIRHLLNDLTFKEGEIWLLARKWVI